MRLVNLIFTVLCVLHVTITLHSIINPAEPEIKIYDKAAKDISFPILFKVCGKEMVNSSQRFRNFGYENALGFFSGFSQYSDDTLVGWHGHTDNGSYWSTIEPPKGAVHKL